MAPAGGLQAEITDVSIGEDGQVAVTFKLIDDAGNPLKANEWDGGLLQMSYIKQDEATGLTEWVAYATAEAEGAEYVLGGETRQPALDSVVRPYFVERPGPDSVTEVAPGTFQYTLTTLLPADYDQNATHRVGLTVSRESRKWVVNTTYDFVPAGGAVQITRELVAIENCNGCHDPLAMHGGWMRDTKMCVLCHTAANVDPESGNPLEFKVMIHKIHRGEFLPSVQAGEPYYIAGFRQTIFDFSTVVWPQDVRNCTTCHTNAPDADNYKNKPSAAACGACHDDVNFETGENHAEGAQPDDKCALCHVFEGVEFDESVVGAHVIPEKSTQLSGLNFEIVEVQDTGPGQSPTVVFNVKDNAGTTIDPAGMDYLALTLAGPTTDYQNRWTEIVASTAFGAPSAAEDASGGNYSYTFQAAIPEDATGTYAVGMEGFVMQEIKGLEEPARQTGFNPVVYVPVTDAEAVARRMVVKTENCNACHKELALHGGIRRNTEYCVMCHNPSHTDVERRPDEEMPPQTVHFKVMVHRIHTGAELVDTKPHIIYGFGGTPFDFSEVRFPGDRRNCEKCHESGTYELPLPKGVLPTTITQEDEVIAEIPPVKAACTACHDIADAKAHADLQTTADSRETCAVCHGRGRDFDVSAVHR